jgi:hypothetical protein
MLMVIFGAGASYDSAQAYPPVYPGSGSQNFGGAPLPAYDGGPHFLRGVETAVTLLGGWTKSLCGARQQVPDI